MIQMHLKAWRRGDGEAFISQGLQRLFGQDNAVALLKIIIMS